jgi:hypothetical protein
MAIEFKLFFTALLIFMIYSIFISLKELKDYPEPVAWVLAIFGIASFFSMIFLLIYITWTH